MILVVGCFGFRITRKSGVWVLRVGLYCEVSVCGGLSNVGNNPAFIPVMARVGLKITKIVTE